MINPTDSTRFGIGDFIVATSSIFNSYLNTAGEKIEGKDKYYLFKNRALTDYIGKFKDNAPSSFTSNNIKYYLNRCRYCIYQEKREIAKDKNGKEIEVDSAEVFSQKTVRLFFEVFGVNFCFLRLHPIDDKAQEHDIEFRRTQEKCLDDLFTVTVHYLCHFQNYDNNRENYGIPICELKNLWELLYRKYRFLLYANTSDEKNTFSKNILLNEELLHHVHRLTQAIKWSALFDTLSEDESGPTTIMIDIEEKTMHLKRGYKHEINRMNKLLQDIQTILKAKEAHEIEEIEQKILPKEELTVWVKPAEDSEKKQEDNVSDEKQEDNTSNQKQEDNTSNQKQEDNTSNQKQEDNTSNQKQENHVSDEVYRKYLWIEQIISYFDRSHKYSFWASVLYLQNFGTAKREYLKCCKTMWEIVSALLKSNYRAVDCLLKGACIKDLICELDETLWVLCYHNGDMNNE